MRSRNRCVVAVTLASLMALACEEPNPPTPPPLDCSHRPTLPLAATLIAGPPASEDFTFDEEGYLLALSGGHSLVRVARDRPVMLINPNVVVTGRGLRVLPGGDVVIADRDRGLIVRVDPAAGDVRRLTTTIESPNGLEIGPGGMLYATDFGVVGDVYRIDPESGTTTVVASPSKNSNGIAFGPGHSVLYVGDHDAGVLLRMTVTADGGASAPEVMASGIGTPDGLTVDACGDVYAASWDRKLYRITTEGQVGVVAEFPSPVSAVAFGSGKQGWNDQSLYVMAIAQGGVFEIKLGRRAANPTRSSFASIPYRPCELSQKVGGFAVALTEHYTSVGGDIAGAVVPLAVPEVVRTTGGCRLLRKRSLFCDPACSPGMTCGEGNQCLPYPTNLSAGTVSVAGLARPVSMQPTAMGQHYWDTTLPHPGFASGSEIRLSATGAEVPAFTLRGWGVSGLTGAAPRSTLQAGQPLTVTWTPGPPGPARVALNISIDQHGLTPMTLICETADTGALEIPPELVTELLAAGTSGFPQLRLARQTVDSVELASGCVELVVAAEATPSLGVAGHIPCRNRSDCPAGQTCAIARESCQ